MSDKKWPFMSCLTLDMPIILSESQLLVLVAETSPIRNIFPLCDSLILVFFIMVGTEKRAYLRKGIGK